MTNPSPAIGTKVQNVLDPTSSNWTVRRVNHDRVQVVNDETGYTVHGLSVKIFWRYFRAI